MPSQRQGLARDRAALIRWVEAKLVPVSGVKDHALIDGVDQISCPGVDSACSADALFKVSAQMFKRVSPRHHHIGVRARRGYEDRQGGAAGSACVT
jgi:hypothetical protein